MKNRARDTSHDLLDDAIASDPSRRASGVQARARRHPSAPPSAALEALLPLISIGSPADPSLLEPTYAYLSSYCSMLFAPRVAERVNVAIYELYANALRYGSTEGEVRLELRRDSSGRGAVLRVTNFTDPGRLARLVDQVASVTRDAESAFNAEMERFGSAVSQPPPMLGIVRIAHESGLALELDAHGTRVEISTRIDG